MYQIFVDEARKLIDRIKLLTNSTYGHNMTTSEVGKSICQKIREHVNYHVINIHIPMAFKMMEKMCTVLAIHISYFPVFWDIIVSVSMFVAFKFVKVAIKWLTKKFGRNPIFLKACLHWRILAYDHVICLKMN